MMTLRRLVFAAIIAAVSAVSASSKDFFVSPSGNDANPGTLAKPFKTLERAREAVWQAKENGLPKGGITVYLRGGEYNLAKTFKLTSQDSGAAASPVTYKAYAKEQPIITSGQVIKGWKKLTDTVPGITPQADGKLWVASVPKGWQFHYLYVNGQAQQVARTPNNNDWHSWPRPDSISPVDPKGQKMTFPKGVLDNLPNNGDVEINFLATWWWNSLSVLRDIDVQAGIARRHSYSVTLCCPDVKKTDFLAYIGTYQLLNSITAIDEPGEWCVNSTEGKVYYWPKGDFSERSVAIAPKLFELIRMQGNEAANQPVHHINIQGIAFKYTDRLAEDKWPKYWLKRQAECIDAALFMECVQDCSVVGNTFTDTGAYAVALNLYAQRNKIIANEMGRLGCGGVQCYGYGPGTCDVNKNNIISRNYIHHTGLAPYWHSPAVSLYCSGSNEISYNWIEQTPYVGVSIVSAAWQDLNTMRNTLLGTNYEGANANGQIVDSYGNWAPIYNARLDELPKAALTRESAKQYLHSGDNKIIRNIVFNDMRILEDGGAFYCWSCGNNNLWSENLLRRVDKSHPIVYMDDWTDYATVEKTMAWASGNWNDNTHGSTIKWDKSNVASYPDKPAGFDERLKFISDEAKKLGGWPASLYPGKILK